MIVIVSILQVYFEQYSTYVNLQSYSTFLLAKNQNLTVLLLNNISF